MNINFNHWFPKQILYSIKLKKKKLSDNQPSFYTSTNQLQKYKNYLHPTWSEDQNQQHWFWSGDPAKIDNKLTLYSQVS